MVRYDPSRSINAMLGRPTKPFDPTSRALGLVARWERAMNRPAGELSDQDLGTLFSQSSSEEERPLLVAAAIARIEVSPRAFGGERFVVVLLRSHRAVLDATPRLLAGFAKALRRHRHVFVGEEEEREVCELLASVEAPAPRAAYDRARSLSELLGYAPWESDVPSAYHRAMNAAAESLDADALEAAYAHFPNAAERRLLAYPAVDLLERDALAAAGRPLLSHLLVDSSSALEEDAALRERLKRVLLGSASIYEGDRDALLVRDFLHPE